MRNSMEINAVIFDYGFTISSEYYFNVRHPAISDWNELIQEVAFLDKEFNNRWLTGNGNIFELAENIHCRTGVSTESILFYLKEGCRCLKENEAVIRFAKYLYSKKTPIAIVSKNFDVFSEIISPSHGYDRLFGAIVNSSDYGTIDKKELWSIAFEQLGSKISYKNTLLIEDSQKEILSFLEEGGNTIHYKGDVGFIDEISQFEYFGNRNEKRR